MAWALVRDNGSIFRKHKTKYRLLKNVIGIKEHISKKSVKSIRDGDTFTVVDSKTYPKWISHPKSGRLSNVMFTETNEYTYTLRYIEDVQHKPKGVKTRETKTNLQNESDTDRLETVSP